MPNETDILPLAETDPAFVSWLQGCQAKIAAYWTAQGYTFAPPPVLKVHSGPRYLIVQSHNHRDGVVEDRGSAYAFVDREGGTVAKLPSKRGDIYKPATWRAPAKHARGNIFADDNGLDCMNQYGPNYMR